MRSSNFVKVCGQAGSPLLAFLIMVFSAVAWGHGVAEGDKGFIEQSTGLQLIPFIYLGAKHMVTGYDHLLFLLGVIFFLYRMREVALYVTLFAVGHSVTLLYGVLAGVHANPFLIDALIGVSVLPEALVMIMSGLIYLMIL